MSNICLNGTIKIIIISSIWLETNKWILFFTAAVLASFPYMSATPTHSFVKTQIDYSKYTVALIYYIIMNKWYIKIIMKKLNFSNLKFAQIRLSETNFYQELQNLKSNYVTTITRKNSEFPTCNMLP